MNAVSTKLNEGQTLCLVPSVWEKDHHNDLANLTYFERFKPAESCVSEWIAQDKRPYWLTLYYLKNAAAVPPTYPDIPIGSHDAGVKVQYAPVFANTYSCSFRALFYDAKELGALADGSGPHGPGTFIVRCGDEGVSSFGCYDLILKVERVVAAGG